MSAKIQQLTVETPESKTPFAEVTIADDANLDKATNYLIARVQIHRRGKSFENVQYDVLDQLRGMLEQAAGLIDETVSKNQ